MAGAVAKAGTAQKAAKDLKDGREITNRDYDCALRDAPMRVTRCRRTLLPLK